MLKGRSTIKHHRINRYINSAFVRVTFDKDNLGIMPIQQAQDLAQQHDLDLVEIVPNAKPPVCQIMDYDKWKYDEKKKLKNQKQKTVQAKEIRLRPVSSSHDVEHKINQLREFLTEKKPVTVNMKFKSRELVNREQGRKIIEELVKKVEDLCQPQHDPKFEGLNLTVRFIPKV